MSTPRIELRAFRADTTLHRSPGLKIVERRRAWREAPTGGSVCITRTAYRRLWGWLWWRKDFGAVVMFSFRQLPNLLLERQLSTAGLCEAFRSAISTRSTPLTKLQKNTLALVGALYGDYDH